MGINYRRIAIGCFFLTVPVLMFMAYSLLTTWSGIPDAYAAWDTGTLVIEHLETHKGKWPRSWDELLAAEKTLDAHGRRLHMETSELPRRVQVDFNAEPAEVGRADPKSVRVVTRADGRDLRVIVEGAEPNAMIWTYLRKKENRNRLGPE